MRKLRTRRFPRILLLLSFLLFIQQVIAGLKDEKRLSSISGGGQVVALSVLDGGQHQIAVDSMRTVADTAFFNPSNAGLLDTSYAVQNQVSLQINEGTLLYLRSAFTVTVQLRISYMSGAGSGDTASVIRSFTVNYDSAGKYNSRSSFVFKGGRQVTVKVLSVTSSVSDWDPTTVLLIENRLTAKPVLYSTAAVR